MNSSTHSDPAERSFLLRYCSTVTGGQRASADSTSRSQSARRCPSSKRSPSVIRCTGSILRNVKSGASTIGPL